MLPSLLVLMPLIIVGASSQTVGAEVLEEITVVAQKRDELLQDVPLAITYLSGSRIESNNLNRIADIAGFVPNFTTTETGASTQMYLRGIGSGNNPGFEQSVGQYIDGVYYGRSQLIRMPFFDLQQLEVLHGPQATLFGRNTISGALNLLSNTPTDSFSAQVSALHEFETGQDELNAVVSGPLGDDVRGRLALRDYSEDGYMYNSFQQRDEPVRDEFAIRGILEWDIADALQLSLKAEQDNFDTRGRQMEILRDEPNRFPPGSTPLAGLNFAGILPLFGQPTHDTRQNFVRTANIDEFSDNRLQNLTLGLRHERGDYRFDAVSAWVQYDFDELCDCDIAAADIFSSYLSEDYEQFSQELRLSSYTNTKLDWLAGVYWQSSQFSYDEQIRVAQSSLLGLLSPALLPVRGNMVARRFGQDSDTFAVFGQYVWNLSRAFSLIFGARYTLEQKDADRLVETRDLASGQISTSPLAGIVFEQAFGIQNQQGSGHQVSGSNRESAFTPAITLQYEPNEQRMYYASLRHGFKPGGYDARANRRSSFAFAEEDALYYELGLKQRLLQGRAEINVALHYTDYENLQISQFDGGSGFNVGNARNSVVQGFDIGGRWRLNDSLQLDYGLAWLDFEFRDFANGNCHARQTPDSFDVDGVPLCDYTGSSGKYTPKQRASLSLNHYRPLPASLTLHTTLDLQYTDKQNVHENLDPAFDIDAYTRLNLRVALETGRYTLALLGSNLLDENIITYAGNVPLTESLFGTNTYYGFLERPRTVALEFRAVF